MQSIQRTKKRSHLVEWNRSKSIFVDAFKSSFEMFLVEFFLFQQIMTFFEFFKADLMIFVLI